MRFLRLIFLIDLLELRLYFYCVFASGGGDLGFKSRAGQIGHSVVTRSQSWQHLFKSCEAIRRNDTEMSAANSLHASA